jgi:acetylornithine deacetylase/succinyl-diaminopimelate desuccinylase-like protein
MSAASRSTGGYCRKKPRPRPWPRSKRSWPAWPQATLILKLTARIRSVRETSWTGLTADCAKQMEAWLIRPEHPLVIETAKALHAIGQTPDFGIWDFATDASYVTGVLGIPTIGYSPMEEQYAHTPSDRVSLEMMKKALAGNAAIAERITG